MQWHLIERTVNYSTAGSTVQCSVQIDHFSGYSFTGGYAFISKTSGKKVIADSFTAFVYITREEDDAREVQVCIVHKAGIEVRNRTYNQGATRRTGQTYPWFKPVFDIVPRYFLSLVKYIIYGGGFNAKINPSTLFQLTKFARNMHCISKHKFKSKW